jgi:2-dehydro-3-deoxygluconokinase
VSAPAAAARRTVVTVGEGLLRLTPPDAAPLVGARTLELHVGGAEANVAAGVASLGVPARWWSRVATGPVGDALLHEVAAAGVDVGLVLRAEGRMGLYVAETGDGDRPTRVTYDRLGTTFAGLRPEHLPDELLAALLDDAAWLHLSGIDLAIDGAPLAALERLWRRAGDAGVRRSFDVNRRATLPGAPALAARAAPYLASADLVFVAERDARALWPAAAAAGDAPALLAALAPLAPRATVAVTRGAAGAWARAAGGALASRAAPPAEGPGRIGRGDAFAAGVLAGLVALGDDLEGALAWGVAAATAKMRVASDLARLDGDAVRALAARTTAAPAGAEAGGASAPEPTR